MKRISCAVLMSFYVVLLSQFCFAGDGRRSVEINLLWPIFPGGISEFRYLMPLAETMDAGDLVLGVYSDFANQVVRDQTYGKVALYAVKFGYRLSFMKNWQWESVMNIGYRKETDRPNTIDNRIEGASVRWWNLVGYQFNLNENYYINSRLGLGSHVYRSDDYASTEKKNVLGLDLNLGFRF